MEKIDLNYNNVIESRLDRYLRSNFPLLTNGLIQKYIRKKDILLNMLKADASFKVQKDDVVSVPEFFERLYKEQKKIDFSGLAISLADKILNDYLVFSNEDLIIINKPSNLPTQGGTNVKISIDHSLAYLNKDIQNYHIVHRLDKDTTGLLIIASNKDSARILTKAFREKKIQKQYKAILQGNLKYNSGWIVDGEYKQNFVIDDYSLNNTITKFELISQNGDFYYIKFTPITGKKHQLRTDSRALGASIVGDIRYEGYKEENMMLHAEKISLSSDIFVYELNFDAELPKHFIQFLKYKKLFN